MNRFIQKMILVAACNALAVSAQAVEQAQKSFHVWFQPETDNGMSPQPENMLSLDISPSVAGLEIWGANRKRGISAPDAANKVAATDYFRLVAKSANGATSVFTSGTSAAAISLKYPNPLNAQFQCAGAHPTFYTATSSWYLGCPSPGGNCPPGQKCFDPATIGNNFPSGRGPSFGGIANSGTNRVLVIGSDMQGSYSNNVDGNIDLGQYSVAVYNLATGALLWTKSWPVLGAGYRTDAG